MLSPTSWHAWRAAVQPAVECILGKRLSLSTSRSIFPQVRTQSIARQSRFLSSSVSRHATIPTPEEDQVLHKEIRERKLELDGSNVEQYPRIQIGNNDTTLKSFISKYDHLASGEKHEGVAPVQVRGRVISIRRAGSKLAFLDILEEPGYHKIQLMLNLGAMDSVDKSTFSKRTKLITRGDVLSVEGTPIRSQSGELSLLANSLPTLLSPCLHQMPLTSYQSQTASERDIEFPERHVEMLTDPSMIPTMVARSNLIKTMRNFFHEKNFLEVQTPILAGAAGGATARPFETAATEFSDRKLWLRIAPELWLKRLILGGMNKIFEIGPSFRNEGLDKTHNPEFTTCEFYAAYHDLPQLQQLTEALIYDIAKAIHKLEGPHLTPPEPALFEKEYASIDFIPALNEALGAPLPNLSTPTARSELIQIFQSHNVALPSKPTLPRLLDKLCAKYLEPQCDQPTWIINTPECLSPLAKSFTHPSCPNDQSVAARAELFIHHREIVNCYEEENSPFEQRRKFMDQQRLAHLPGSGTTGENTTDMEASDNIDEEAQKIDHDYLRALEWGLPPTGGWGCGIDRLVMLFTGKEKIDDVLSFGNLRAVTRGAQRRSVHSGQEK